MFLVELSKPRHALLPPDSTAQLDNLYAVSAPCQVITTRSQGVVAVCTIVCSNGYHDVMLAVLMIVTCQTFKAVTIRCDQDWMPTSLTAYSGRSEQTGEE